jgi:hypothetical protein
MKTILASLTLTNDLAYNLAEGTLAARLNLPNFTNIWLAQVHTIVEGEISTDALGVIGAYRLKPFTSESYWLSDGLANNPQVGILQGFTGYAELYNSTGTNVIASNVDYTAVEGAILQKQQYLEIPINSLYTPLTPIALNVQGDLSIGFIIRWPTNAYLAYHHAGSTLTFTTNFTAEFLVE